MRIFSCFFVHPEQTTSAIVVHQEFVNQNAPVWLHRIQDPLEQPPAAFLAEMVEQLETSYPGFKARLVDENGEMRYFVNIYVNGEDVRFLQGLATNIKSGDEVSIVPAVAGGL